MLNISQRNWSIIVDRFLLYFKFLDFCLPMQSEGDLVQFCECSGKNCILIFASDLLNQFIADKMSFLKRMYLRMQNIFVLCITWFVTEFLLPHLSKMQFSTINFYIRKTLLLQDLRFPQQCEYRRWSLGCCAL